MQNGFDSCANLWTWASVTFETRVYCSAILAITLAAIVLYVCLRIAARRCHSFEGVSVDAPSESSVLLGSTGDARLTWLDNSRFLLIATIVFGHVVAVPTLFVPERDYYMQPLLVLTSLYHIPMLSFISGVLSKRTLTQDRVARLITYVVAPYIFSKLSWWMYFYIRSPIYPSLNLFDCYQSGGLEWYLAALLFWRILLALLSPLNTYALLATSFALGLVSGYWVGNDQAFALQRAFAFFPFAAAGYLFDASAAQHLLGRVKLLGVAARCILFTLLVFCVQHRALLSNLDLGTLGDLNFDYFHVRVENSGWVWLPRTPCGLEWHLSWTHRAARYALHFFAGAVFLAAVPIEKCVFTEAGSHTMYPYLLHTWVTMAIAPLLENHQAFFHYIVSPTFYPGGWVWSIAGICAFPLTLLLSSNPIRRTFGCVIEPEWIGRLFFKQAVACETSEKKSNDTRHYKAASCEKV